MAAVESRYIFKRPKQQKTVEAIKRQVSVAEADVAMQKDRAVWSERMARKGYLSDKQVQLEKQRLNDAEIALDRAERELKAFSTEPKKLPEKDLKPQK